MSRSRSWYRLALVVLGALYGLLLSPFAAASIYNAELSQQTLSGPDLCADAPCRDVMPGAQIFSKRKGMPAYVEAYAVEKGKQRLIGYVFLSTDVVDIPAYSGKPVITLIGMDLNGIITGVRILKHSEPILLAGLPESVLTNFVKQYIGKAGDANLEIGHEQNGDGAQGLDAISGATVTAIAENQVIAQSAFEIGKEVGIFKSVSKPRAHFTALKESLDWNALLKEGDVQHLRVEAGDVGVDDSSQPYMDLYFGYLNVPTVGISILGPENYERLMRDLKEDEHAIFVIANGQVSFKGSGFVRGGIYDRIQVHQDSSRFTFRDTDYQNLYRLAAAGAPEYKESGIFIVRNANFNPAWPWELSLLANKLDPQTRTKTFAHFDREYWLPARFLEGGRPKVVRPEKPWIKAWTSRKGAIAAFALLLLGTAVLYSQRDKLARASTRKHKPWISWPRYALWTISVLFFGLYLKAQPSITQVLTWFHSVIYHWNWELFLSDPFIFLFWWFTIVTVFIWGRGLFCGWLCPFGSLQHLAYKLGQLIGLKRFQGLLPKKLHDKLRWTKYVVFAVLLGVSLYSMEMAERMAEIEPFKTAFLVGIWNRSWPFVTFVLVILGVSILSERPYCKYICPLGASLAVPSQLRLFPLKRKKECETCHACATGCGSHAIDAQGRIDQKECLACLDCMVLYYDDHACPPLAKERKQRERAGLPLTKIDGKGYFIPLEQVRRNLADVAAKGR